jgi:hypothetical protein
MQSKTPTHDLMQALAHSDSPGGSSGPIDQLVVDMIRGVDAEMRHQPASMIYELMTLEARRRLPGIAVDEERLRDAAARIAVGLPIS